MRFISQLDHGVTYNYVNWKNSGLIKIDNVGVPEGPIYYRRGKDTADLLNAKTETISSEMIWRVANAIEPNVPINLDRVLGASYNSRSVLEALLAHTSEFYYCYPGRVESMGNRTTFKAGHKHLLWAPTSPHQIGMIQEIKTDRVISELPTQSVYYESLTSTAFESPEIDIAASRRHAQIQIALYFIGLQLGYRTWIAKNDHSIVYENKKILEYKGVVRSLREEGLMNLQQGVVEAASLIDCIWFKNGSLLPAIMEIEHSTGVTSGLTRMQKLQSLIPGIKTKYVIVAPDEMRSKVKSEANKTIYRELEALFFPYSAVEELYSLCQRRRLKGVTQEFLDCFMEKMLDE